MNVDIHTTKREPAELPVEIVERKGRGHPDTLSDALAECLSQVYSQYTLSRFGAILRHQFDKVAVLCGKTRVTFGKGHIVEPIRVLLNGRASARLGDENIPLQDMLTEATRTFFKRRFPMLDPVNDLRILFETRSGMHTTTGGIFDGPGEAQAPIHYRFHPRTLHDLPETAQVQSNDTSLGFAYAPYSPLERLVLAADSALESAAREDWRWLGSDTKFMAVRRDRRVSLVAAVPVLCSLTRTPDEYLDRVRAITQRIRDVAAAIDGDLMVEEVVVNSGDDPAAGKLYMNFTGSSMESGDEGMVGRGNRIGGVISPMRSYTAEGLAGKNPRYHVGKVYSAAAYEIASRLHARHGVSSNIFLINRMGEPLATPWCAVAETTAAPHAIDIIASTVEGVMANLESITQSLLAGKYPLF